MSGLLSLRGLVGVACVGFGLLALKKYVNGPLSKHNPKTTDMKRKTVVVTGATAGLGRAAALEMLRMNAHVVLACRDAAKGAKVAAELAAEAKAASAADGTATPVGTVEPMTLDVSDLSSVRAFAAAFAKSHTRLDVLINNAGIPDPVEGKLKSKDGFELVFATNHLGSFALTNALLPVLKASAPSRVINLASALEGAADLDLDDLEFVKRPYGGAYNSSKLCNILFNSELARRLNGSGVVTTAMTPGFVPSTEITGKVSGSWFYRSLVGRALLWPISKDMPHGIATIVDLAAAPHDTLVNGGYYNGCAPATPRHKLAADTATAQRLWSISEQMVAKAGFPVASTATAAAPADTKKSA